MLKGAFQKQLPNNANDFLVKQHCWYWRTVFTATRNSWKQGGEVFGTHDNQKPMLRCVSRLLWMTQVDEIVEPWRNAAWYFLIIESRKGALEEQADEAGDPSWLNQRVWVYWNKLFSHHSDKNCFLGEWSIVHRSIGPILR